MRSLPSLAGPSLRRRLLTCVSMLRSKGENSRRSTVPHHLVTRDHAAGGLQQHVEQIEFDGREVDHGPRASRDPSALVDRHIIDHEAIGAARLDGRRVGPRAAQDGLDPRAQFAGIERLRQVVVGAHLQAQDPILLVAARRQHQDRRARRRADAPEDFKSPDVGQHHVEHDDRGQPRQRAFDALTSRMQAFDDVAVGDQVLRQQLAQLDVVVNHEDGERVGVHREVRPQVAIVAAVPTRTFVKICQDAAPASRQIFTIR